MFQDVERVLCDGDGDLDVMQPVMTMDSFTAALNKVREEGDRVLQGGKKSRNRPKHSQHQQYIHVSSYDASALRVPGHLCSRFVAQNNAQALLFAFRARRTLVADPKSDASEMLIKEVATAVFSSAGKQYRAGEGGRFSS